MKKDFDVIVIGSGAGGLTASVALAQAGMKVLVCERHEVPGGWCHSFSLEGFTFSPGVHYVGELNKGGSLREILEGLGISGEISFYELNPKGYDHIFLGERRFDFPAGKENLIEYLADQFPKEKKGIKNYIDTVSGMIESLTAMGDSSPHKMKPLDAMKTLKWGLRSGKDLIEKYISDPFLKGVLSGQSGDHGLPPSQVSAFVHAGITNHYLNGGYYPAGGGHAIPRALIRALKRAGGEILLNAPVERIILNGKKVGGVKLADGRVITSRYVVSNADPEVTFGKLIGREFLSGKLRRKLDRVKYSVSGLSLFLAVDMDLQEAGLDSGNFWFYDNEDVDSIYRLGMTDYIMKANKPLSFFLNVTSLKDPSKVKNGIHTCEVFTFVSFAPFRKWVNSRHGSRPPEYEKTKELLMSKMLKALDERIPGLSNHVVMKNLGTPLTNLHFLNTTYGNLYGIAKTKNQVGPFAFNVKSEIDGLYLCGASTVSHGVAGVIQSGLAAASKLLHCRKDELLNQKGPEVEIK